LADIRRIKIWWRIWLSVPTWDFLYLYIKTSKAACSTEGCLVRTSDPARIVARSRCTTSEQHTSFNTLA